MNKTVKSKRHATDIAHTLIRTMTVIVLTVQVEEVELHLYKEQRPTEGSRSIAPLILNFGQWSASSPAAVKAGWVDPNVLETEKKLLSHPRIKPRGSSSQ